MRGVKAKVESFTSSRYSPEERTRLYRLGDELEKKIHRALEELRRDQDRAARSEIDPKDGDDEK